MIEEQQQHGGGVPDLVGKHVHESNIPILKMLAASGQRAVRIWDLRTLKCARTEAKLTKKTKTGSQRLNRKQNKR